MPEPFGELGFLAALAAAFCAGFVCAKLATAAPSQARACCGLFSFRAPTSTPSPAERLKSALLVFALTVSRGHDFAEREGLPAPGLDGGGLLPPLYGTTFAGACFEYASDTQRACALGTYLDARLLTVSDAAAVFDEFVAACADLEA